MRAKLRISVLKGNRDELVRELSRYSFNVIKEKKSLFSGVETYHIYTDKENPLDVILEMEINRQQIDGNDYSDSLCEILLGYVLHDYITDASVQLGRAVIIDSDTEELVELSARNPSEYKYNIRLGAYTSSG